MWPRGTKVAVITGNDKHEHARSVLVAVKRTGAVRKIYSFLTYDRNFITFLGLPRRKAQS